MYARRARKPNGSTSELASQGPAAEAGEFVSNQSIIEQMNAEKAASQITVEGSTPGSEADGASPNLCFSFLTKAPDGATIADLDAGGAIEADTEYVKLTAGSTLYLNVGVMGGAELAQFEQWVAEAGGHFALNDQGRLVLGAPTAALHLDANTEGAQPVLQGANDRANNPQNADQVFDGAVWTYLNGGETVLEKEDAIPQDWREDQIKPGAWYNGYEIKDDAVVPVAHPFDTSGVAAPEMGVDGLKGVIMRSMDVAGVANALGNNYAAFAQALTERFGAENPLKGTAFTALCDELWSYLKTGAGTDGRVDIGRLQAVVRAISPDTRATADTNTEFDGESFEIGEDGQQLNRGDGVFGRATMMSLMHLFGSFTQTASQPPTVGLVQGDLFSERDLFLIDASGTMDSDNKWQNVQGSVNESMGWTPGTDIGSRTVGTFEEYDVSIDGEPDTDMAECLAKAYATLYPANSADDRASFAALFRLEPGAIFTRGRLDGAELMKQIGDVGGRNDDYGAGGESGLKAALALLTSAGAGALANPSAQPGERTRINAVMDEGEQAPEYLELVKALANQLSVDVRLICVPTDSAEYDDETLRKFVFVDLDDIEIGTDREVTMTYTLNGQEHTQTVRLTNPRRDEADAPDRFRDRKIFFGNLQGAVGDSN